MSMAAPWVVTQGFLWCAKHLLRLKMRSSKPRETTWTNWNFKHPISLSSSACLRTLCRSCCLLSNRINSIIYNDPGGVIKDQYIANLSIEDMDLAPITAFWIKEKLHCLFTQQAVIMFEELAHIRK